MQVAEVVLQSLTLVVVGLYTFLTYRLLSAQTRQGFENKFFQLLRFHHDIVNAVRVKPTSVGLFSASGSALSGREAFHALYNRFVDHYNAKYKKNPQAPPDRLASEAYASFYEEHQESLGHYFRNLYHLVKFVDRSSVDAKDKEFYTHLVRAQMSSDELLLLFYNCHSSFGRRKFYPLVERYALVENMSQGDLASRRLKLSADDKSIYRPCAYGEP
jgi:hypothetical protein